MRHSHNALCDSPNARHHSPRARRDATSPIPYTGSRWGKNYSQLFAQRRGQYRFFFLFLQKKPICLVCSALLTLKKKGNCPMMNQLIDRLHADHLSLVILHEGRVATYEGHGVRALYHICLLYTSPSPRD